MSEQKQINIYPYVVKGTDDLRLAKQAVAAAFNGKKFRSAADNRVVISGETLLVTIDPLFHNKAMTIRVARPNKKSVEIPCYQFR